MATLDILKGKTWTQNNMFKVQFMNSPIDKLEHNIKSVNLPDFTESAVEEYYNGTWYYTYGKQEIYMITINFVDNEQDKVYEKALKFWYEQRHKYPDEKWFQIKVQKTKRSDRNSPFGGVLFKNCIMDSISGLQLDNSAQNQLLEFSITFKTSKIEPLG